MTTKTTTTTKNTSNEYHQIPPQWIINKLNWQTETRRRGIILIVRVSRNFAEEEQKTQAQQILRPTGSSQRQRSSTNITHRRSSACYRAVHCLFQLLLQFTEKSFLLSASLATASGLGRVRRAFELFDDAMTLLRRGSGIVAFTRRAHRSAGRRGLRLSGSLARVHAGGDGRFGIAAATNGLRHRADIATVLRPLGHGCSKGVGLLCRGRVEVFRNIGRLFVHGQW